VTPRPAQPEPFLRGAPYPAAGDVPYPRANPADTARLPSDTWHAAIVPAGVRLELVGDAEAIDIAYRTTSGNLGYRGDGAGITFSVWRAGRKVGEEEAVLGDGLIRVPLGSSSAEKPAIIYLPEGMQPLIQSLTAVKGEIRPAPDLPRWVAYGDSVTQGWIASGPAQGWAAIAARKAGLDLANLGYAAAGRGEIVSAEHIADLPADIISLAYGASCWSRIPHSVGMVAEGFAAFLDVVRDGHPTTPIVVVSPLLRPDAEDEPNRLGATLADIRHTIESITRDRIVSGDQTLALVAGESIIAAEHLGDGIHPDDEGHKRIAATVGKALGLALRTSKELPPADVMTADVMTADVMTADVMKADVMKADGMRADVMKDAATSLSAGRMTRGRGDGGVDRGSPGRGGGRDGRPTGGPGRGRAASRIRDNVKVGAAVGSGVGAGSEVVDGVEVGAAPEDGVIDEYEYETADGAELESLAVAEEFVEEFVEDLTEGEAGADIEVEADLTESDPGADVEVDEVEDVEVDESVEVDEVDEVGEVEELEEVEEVEDTTESVPDSLAREPIVAGEYVYEDYVDYENDVEFRYTDHASGYERHEAAAAAVEAAGVEAAVEAEVEAGAEATAEAEVDVKRKGGGRKGRGVAATSSSR
jgi:pentapeptide MXKDX repeat protein